MVVEIETMVMPLDSRLPRIFIRLVNALVCAKSEEEIREKIKKFCTGDEENLSYFFVWGFGAHHFWMNQRLTDENGEVCPERLLIVRF